jgi:hypothetical protein
MGAAEALEHAHHVAHSDGGHGGGHDHGGGDKLSRWVGITMATLGVVLAFAAARVGAQRTELVQALVDQQHAHAKSTSHDIKHRVAMMLLRQFHADADVNHTNPTDVLAMINAAERYGDEANRAEHWMDSYDELIEAHMKGQEDYELAQLAAEVGLVIASIALLLKRMLPWLVSVGLGIVAIGILALTYFRTSGKVHEYEEITEHNEKDWEDRHDKLHDQFAKTDREFLDQLSKDYHITLPSPPPPPPSGGGEHQHE